MLFTDFVSLTLFPSLKYPLHYFFSPAALPSTFAPKQLLCFLPACMPSSNFTLSDVLLSKQYFSSELLHSSNTFALRQLPCSFYHFSSREAIKLFKQFFSSEVDVPPKPLFLSSHCVLQPNATQQSTLLWLPPCCLTLGQPPICSVSFSTIFAHLHQIDPLSFAIIDFVSSSNQLTDKFTKSLKCFCCDNIFCNKLDS